MRCHHGGQKTLNVKKQHWTVCITLTLLFRRSLSLNVSVSAFAMTGTMLTLLWMAFMNSTSRGFKLNRKNITERKEKVSVGRVLGTV